MSLEEDLRTRLLADASLSTLIGTRLYPDQAPQEASRPYVTYSREGAFRPIRSGGTSGLERPRVVYEAFAATRDVARQISARIVAVLHVLAASVGTTEVRLAMVDDEIDDHEGPRGKDEEAVYTSRVDVLAWIEA